MLASVCAMDLRSCRLDMRSDTAAEVAAMMQSVQSSTWVGIFDQRLKMVDYGSAFVVRKLFGLTINIKGSITNHGS